ncbi:MAG TPA: ABC transporter permease subunit [Opitutaceae bacterium]|nr:ABC transporter permease subunit [Opitutaceae bacterium]
MSQPAAVFPVARVAPNLWHAFGGVWRLTYRKFTRPEQWLVFAGVYGLLAMMEIAIVRDGRSRAFSEFFIKFYMTFVVPMSAFLSGAGALRDEMKAGSAEYVLTRPVLRPPFVAFKFFSHLVCVQLLGALALALIVYIAQLRHIPALGNVVPSLILAQVLTVTAFTALGFFCGVLTSRFLVLGLVYAAVIEVGLGRIPTQISRLSLTHQIADYLEPLMPAAAPLVTGVVPPGAVVTTVTFLLFSAVALGLAAAIFTLRELIGEAARDA